MTYEIVKYRSDLKGEVLKHLSVMWGPNHSVYEAQFAWKYERNPFQREPLLYLVLSGGRVVGMRGMCGTKWEAGAQGCHFDIPCVGDLSIDPHHTNRGLISKIVRFALEDLRQRGAEYVFNTSPGPVTFLNSLAMGWRTIGPLQLVSRKFTKESRTEKLRKMLEQCPPALHLARSVKKLPLVQSYARTVMPAPALNSAAPLKAEALFAHLDRNFRLAKNRSKKRVFLDSSSRPEAMADLVRRIGSDGKIRHVKDREYFGWRFLDPRSVFRFLYWGRPKLEGYLVLEATGPFSQDRRIAISDWEATSVRVLDDLMETAIRLGEFEEMHTWRAAVPNATRKLLDRAGFRPRNQASGKPEYTPTVLVRPTGGRRDPAEWRLGGNRVLDAARWGVRPIYSL